MEFQAFSVPRKRRNSDGINQNLRLFRLLRNNFLLENGSAKSSLSAIFWKKSQTYTQWATSVQTCTEKIHKESNLCTATATPFIYSFSGNCAASAPISTFMCLWTIYIFPGSVHIFPPAEKADPSWKYIIRSQTHECGNWDWGLDIPFLGIFGSNFRHFVFAVCSRLTC